jgi:hypothetical protein
MLSVFVSMTQGCESPCATVADIKPDGFVGVRGGPVLLRTNCGPVLVHDAWSTLDLTSARRIEQPV